MDFAELETAFDRVLREAVWWAFRRLGVEEWLVPVIGAMYEGITTTVKMKDEESAGFEVKVGVYKGLMVNPCCSLL
jgi:hypothetical protein